MIELIPATTATVTTYPIIVEYGKSITFVAHGLGSEEIALQAEYAPGLFTGVYEYTTEEAITLKATTNIVPITVPGVYRLVKPTTASAVTVGLHVQRN